MKAGWEAHSLGDLCDILDYKRKPITKSDRVVGQFPYYGATGILDYVEGYLFDEKLVLVGEDGAKWASGENTAFKVEGKCWVNNHAHVLRPHRRTLIDNWLIYFLNHSDLSEWVSGLTVPKLNQGSLREISIPVPPLPEQQRLVALLDEAFDRIATAKANAEQNLENARAVFDSHLEAVFSQRGEGWVETTLDKLSVNLDNKRVPITKSDRTSGEYPYYGASGIVDYVADYIFDGDMLLVSEDGANLLARSTPIAFAVSGKCWVNNHAHILKFKCMATQRFVELYLASIKLDEFITGAAQPKLNQKALNSIPIPIPKSTDAQAKIVERLNALAEETQHLEALYRRKLAALEELKKALLAQAFAGEL